MKPVLGKRILLTIRLGIHDCLCAFQLSLAIVVWTAKQSGNHYYCHVYGEYIRHNFSVCKLSFTLFKLSWLYPGDFSVVPQLRNTDHPLLVLRRQKRKIYQTQPLISVKPYCHSQMCSSTQWPNEENKTNNILVLLHSFKINKYLKWSTLYYSGSRGIRISFRMQFTRKRKHVCW